jgi:hypothetical protein
MPETAATPAVLYQGRTCACVEAGQGCYAVVTRASNRVVGELRWHARQQCWMFVPAPGTSFTSGTLADLGVWLRRLSRAAQSPYTD